MHRNRWKQNRKSKSRKSLLSRKTDSSWSKLRPRFTNMSRSLQLQRLIRSLYNRRTRI